MQSQSCQVDMKAMEGKGMAEEVFKPLFQVKNAALPCRALVVCFASASDTAQMVWLLLRSGISIVWPYLEVLNQLERVGAQRAMVDDVPSRLH